MSVIDRVTDRDEPTEVPTVGKGGDGGHGGAESVALREARTPGEAYADLRQAVEAGWDRHLRFSAPRDELARFKLEDAGLPEVSIEEADQYVKRQKTILDHDRIWSAIFKGGAGEKGWRVVSLRLRAGLAGLVHAGGHPAEPSLKAQVRRGTRMSAEAVEMVTIPRAELDVLKAELRRLRREVGRSIARACVQAGPDPAGDALTFTRGKLAEAWGISE